MPLGINAQPHPKFCHPASEGYEGNICISTGGKEAGHILGIIVPDGASKLAENLDELVSRQRDRKFRRSLDIHENKWHEKKDEETLKKVSTWRSIIPPKSKPKRHIKFSLPPQSEREIQISLLQTQSKARNNHSSVENRFAVMAVTSSPVGLTENEVVEKKSRTKSPGVRVVGGRIYDSQNWKTCHQVMDDSFDWILDDKWNLFVFVFTCLADENMQENERNLSLKLLYGEKAEEVALLDDWQCPKCRGICNCSFCMKKRGHKPTGILAHTAKENGFSSVSELLHAKGPENLNHYKYAKDNDVLPKKSASSEKESTVTLPPKSGKENSFDGNIDMNLHSQNLTTISAEKKSKKTKRKRLEEGSNGNRDAETRLKESGQKKAKKKRTKEVDSGSRNGEASSKESGWEKPGITEVSKNKMKTNEKDKCDVVKDKSEAAFVEKKMFKTHPQEVSKNEVLLGTKYDGGIVCGVRNNKIQTKIEIDGDSSKVNKFPAEFQTKSKTTKERHTTELWKKETDVDIQLPQGTCLMAVAGFELPPEDVGNALQLLEFCASFGKVLGLKKGQAEAILGEIINGHRGRRSQSYHLAQIHVQLVHLLQKDIGEESPALSATNDNSWFQALGKCVSECLFISNEIPSDCFGSGNEGYDKLNSSEKLRLLNSLCDEALNTKELRSWIEDENSKFLERQKQVKEKVLAAKDKEKALKKKMTDEVAKSIIEKHGAPTSVSDNEEMVSQIRSEVAQAHAEMVEAMDMVKKKRLSDAVRTDPVLLDIDGRAFWKLNAYNGQSDILLQDMGTWNSVARSEKWFIYADGQKKDLEKYISSSRTKRLRVQKATETPAIEIDETKLATETPSVEIDETKSA
ncbi:unnamed protein product [Dovyalis caffra]|uniref:DDT domain-containing protein n=1 Tax=Dovyalis caffra TaxID=77055 RepID=A0AAV1SLD4_9ROSI|nr:unnamed protein product [Dovyalis caffra]